MSTIVLTITNNESTATNLDRLSKPTSNPHAEAAALSTYFEGMSGGCYSAKFDVQVSGGNAAAASKAVTVASPISGDAVVINGVAFTAGSSFAIGISDTATATNLKTAINASVNALISGVVVATSALGVVTLTASSVGVAGNTISVECLGSNGVSVAGAGVHASATLTSASVAAADTAVVNGVTVTATEKREITTVQCVADVAGSLNSKFFTIFSGGNGTGYYVWYNVNSAGVDPAPVGKTGIVVALATGATANTVASSTRTAIAAVSASFTASVVTDTVTVTTVATGVTTDAADGSAPTSFTIVVTNQGGAVGATQFQIGSNSVTATNLAAAINAQAGLASIAVATVSGAVVTVKAYRAGLAGNAVTLAATGGVSASASRLASGTAPSVILLSGGTAASANSYAFGVA